MLLNDFIAHWDGYRDVTATEMAEVFPELFNTGADAKPKIDFLTRLYRKGESVGEIAAAATYLRKLAVKLPEIGRELVDCCGTGGDQKGTANVSTAVAFVLAGAGCRVAKHGNRAVSSRSGSADVLEALGVKTDLTPAMAISCLEKTGIVFLLAPLYHPAFKNVAELRQAIPHRTIFNLLGPLINPLLVRRQLVGVAEPKLVPVIAKALIELGTDDAIVVASEDGYDEFSLTAPARVARVRGGKIEEFVFDAVKDTGYPRCRAQDLCGGNPKDNALRLKQTLKGHSEPLDHVVHINAAWGLIATGKADNFMDALMLVEEAISSGSAYAKLEALSAFRG